MSCACWKPPVMYVTRQDELYMTDHTGETLRNGDPGECMHLPPGDNDYNWRLMSIHYLDCGGDYDILTTWEGTRK